MRTLYSGSYVDKNGMRRLMAAAQGRFMKPTREKAQEWLDQILRSEGGRGEEGLVDIYGEQSRGTFRVDAFECHDHGDPVGIYVEETE